MSWRCRDGGHGVCQCVVIVAHGAADADAVAPVVVAAMMK
jgi:hypothetical protein